MNLACAICSDLFTPSDDVHLTPCGHSFHYVCLIHWLERSNTCPQCRNKCSEINLIKVYFNIPPGANPESTEGTEKLLHKLDNLTFAMRELEQNRKEYELQEASYKTRLDKMKNTILALEKSDKKKDATILACKLELEMLRGDRAQRQSLQFELKELTDKMKLMSIVEHAVASSAREVENMLARDSNPRTLAVLAATLKRELEASDAQTDEMRGRIKLIQSELEAERAKRKHLEDQLSTADSEMYRLESEIKRMKMNAMDFFEDDEFDAILLTTPDEPLTGKRSEASETKSTSTTSPDRKKSKPQHSNGPINTFPIFRKIQSTIIPRSCNTGKSPVNKQQTTAENKEPISGSPIRKKGNPSLFRRTDTPFLVSPLTLTKSTGTESATTLKQMAATTPSIVSRLKAGKLKKHPSAIDIRLFGHCS